MATKVFKYGLLPPIQGQDYIKEQMRLAWEYRRDVTVGPLKEQRAALRDVSRHDTVVKTAKKNLDRLSKQLDRLVLKKTKQQQKTRTRSAPPALMAEIAAVRNDRKVAKTALYDARHAAKNVAKRDVITTEYNQQRNAIRGQYVEGGLYWGTYQGVDESLAQADRTTHLYDDDAVTPMDPWYPGWNGAGRVRVHIQGTPLPTATVLAGTSPCFRIERTPDRFLEASGKGKNRRGGGANRAEFGQLWLRVGSDPTSNRVPRWGVWPIKMHRPLPSAALVTAATVTLRYVATRPVWTVEITVEDLGGAVEPCGSGTVAIDLGWSVQPDGAIRTAYWRDQDGQHGSLDLSPGLVSALRKAEELQSIRDKLRDIMTEQVIKYLGDKMPGWLRDYTVKRGTTTPTVAEAQVTMRKWRSAARWWRIAKDARWGAEGCPDFLAMWVNKDRHLWEWERNQSVKARNRRKDEYRVWAAQMTRRYSTIVLEAEMRQRRGTSVLMDMSKLARKANTEDPPENETARSNRQLAAPGELRLALVHAAKSRDCKVAMEPAANTTRECPFHDCQHVDTYDTGASSNRPPCSACGRSWSDVDDGSCVVMLRRHDAKVQDGSIVFLGQNPKESRYSRRRRATQEKKDRMQLAI